MSNCAASARSRLNGTFHQIGQKVEGNMTFPRRALPCHPQPVAAWDRDPGPLKVPADQLAAMPRYHVAVAKTPERIALNDKRSPSKGDHR